MNLELINELTYLHAKNTSYTEMAEITGIARTSIVLALRLNTIFENSYLPKVMALNDEIKVLKSNIESLENQMTTKDVDIKNLNSLINADDESHMIISKNLYQAQNNELFNLKTEVDSLNAQLSHENNYLNNLSFGDKIKILFQ